MTSPAADTPSIAAFIEARLDERDELARDIRLSADPASLVTSADVAGLITAEVAKDRAILALHSGAHSCGRRQGGLSARVLDYDDAYPCQAVRLLAAIDADREGYDPAWKPQAS